METIDDMDLINKRKKKKSKQILGSISEMSNSNSEAFSTEVMKVNLFKIIKNKRLLLKVIFIKKRNRW